MPSMTLFNAFVLFVCIWWTVLFAVLPWKVKPSDAPLQGTARSAPETPHIGLKFLVTTGISIVSWGVFYGLILWDPFDVKSLMRGSGF